MHLRGLYGKSAVKHGFILKVFFNEFYCIPTLLTDMELEIGIQYDIAVVDHIFIIYQLLFVSIFPYQYSVYVF